MVVRLVGLKKVEPFLQMDWRGFSGILTFLHPTKEPSPVWNRKKLGFWYAFSRFKMHLAKRTPFLTKLKKKQKDEVHFHPFILTQLPSKGPKKPLSI